jgi:hypothetical protein
VKRTALAIPLVSLPFLVASLPAGAADKETRALTGFNAIAVGGGIDLFLRQGEPFRVEVSASDRELDEIVTEVTGGKLEIRRRRPAAFLDWGDRGFVSVILPRLTALAASGGSDVDTEGVFSGEGLEIVASGGSDMTIDVAVKELDVTASGGSDVEIRGRAGLARVQASGGSDLDASRLSVEDAEVQSSGGSDLSIAVRSKIVANASGGSDISYTGEPSIVTVDTSGGSGVRRR